MNANELRIGNWYHHNDSPSASEYEGDFILTLDHFYDLTTRKLLLESIEPIPLTEEWLLKFGFDKTLNHIDHDFILNEMGICFDLDEEGYFLSKVGWMKCIKYVHQLQNLYWCLCGEELKINIA